ncbi:hypothetical protein EJB05_33521, partial [Eragrostis curvula]
MGAHTGRRCNSSSSTTRRVRPPASSAVAPRRPSPTSNCTTGDGKVIRTTRSRDMAAVRMRMEALRRLVPSDGGDHDDELLLRAAGYIARLQAQVQMMQLMVDVLENAHD